MKKTFAKWFSIILIAIFAYSCKNETCKFESIKTLYITTGIHDLDTAYGHYVLLKGFSKNCMDSATIVNIALKYIDTVKKGNPVNTIMFYKSDKEFSTGEVPSSVDLEKYCLVKIGFNKTLKKPNDFVFYNDKGKNIYWGVKWKPNGDVK